MGVFISCPAPLNADPVWKTPQINENATEANEADDSSQDSPSSDQENQSELASYYQTTNLFPDSSTAQAPLNCLQSAPPTKHPIERKTEKALLLPFIIPVSALAGIAVGATIASCFQFTMIPAFVFITTASIIGIGLGIHYGWSFINTRYKD